MAEDKPQTVVPPVAEALPTGGVVAAVGTAPETPPGTPESQTPGGTDVTPAFTPITTQGDLDRILGHRLNQQRVQLEPRIRQTVLAELQPQLDELTQIKESQKSEFERLTGQVTQLTTEKVTLAERAAAGDRKDMIYAVLAERQERLPTKFWPLIEGMTQDEIKASIDSLMEDAKALAGAVVAPQSPGVSLAPEVGLGSPASPPATLQPRPAQPVNLEEAGARLDAIRRGDPDAVAANIKQHLPQVGPAR